MGTATVTSRTEVDEPLPSPRAQPPWHCPPGYLPACPRGLAHHRPADTLRETTVRGITRMAHPLAAELAPHGVLRAGINMSNFLLVTGRSASGDPQGVSPSMAAAIAERLGVPGKYVPFAKPGELADEAGKDVWDIGLIGAEPARAEKIDFTAAYAEIEATYMVPPGSPLRTIADVDKPGVRIAVSARSAYDLWLERNIRHAEVVPSEGGGGAGFKQFVDNK